MNHYTVVGTPEADNDLADLWMDATDRAAVTAAQDQIDRELARDPHRAGSEVAEGLWRIHVSPLKVYYEINDLDQIVQITGIGRLG